MTNQTPDKKWAWLIVLVILLIVLQFFWVLNSYYMLESKKVLWWMLKYFSIPYVIGAFLILKKFNNLLFYSYTERYQEKHLTRWNQFRNKSTSYGLIVLMASFFTYDSIIQTNDWFGSSEQEQFNQIVKKADLIQHGGSGRSRSFSGRISRSFGNTYETSDVHLIYKDKEVIISSSGVWNVGDTLKSKLNTGGFWGVLYAKRQL